MSQPLLVLAVHPVLRLPPGSEIGLAGVLALFAALGRVSRRRLRADRATVTPRSSDAG
jgi:hypothetical protein